MATLEAVNSTLAAIAGGDTGWESRRHQGSFRGVPFITLENSARPGRRNVINEYPLKNKPYIQDLGRKAREFAIKAYVVGDNYDLDRDALFEALETEGPGRLVHPAYGEMTVSVIDADIIELEIARRAAEINMVFIESGELEFPTVSSDAAESIVSRVTEALDMAADEFEETLDIVTQPVYVFQAASTKLTAELEICVARMRNKSMAAAQAINDIIAALPSVLVDPGAVAASVQAGVQLITDLPTLAALSVGAGSALAITATTEAAQVEQANSNAIDRLMARSMAIQGASVAADETYTDYDDAIFWRDLFADRLNSEIELTPENGDTHAALIDLRTSMAASITDQSADLKRLRNITQVEPIPAMVIAYELFADANRQDEITNLNEIPLPGFVSGQLRVPAS